MLRRESYFVNIVYKMGKIERKIKSSDTVNLKIECQLEKMIFKNRPLRDYRGFSEFYYNYWISI